MLRKPWRFSGSISYWGDRWRSSGLNGLKKMYHQVTFHTDTSKNIEHVCKSFMTRGRHTYFRWCDSHKRRSTDNSDQFRQEYHRKRSVGHVWHVRRDWETEAGQKQRDGRVSREGVYYGNKCTLSMPNSLWPSSKIFMVAVQTSSRRHKHMHKCKWHDT